MCQLTCGIVNDCVCDRATLVLPKLLNTTNSKVGGLMYTLEKSFREMLCQMLESVGITETGALLQEALEKSIIKLGKDSEELVIYENEVFAVFPYYWGRDALFKSIPNFEYKPMGLQIFWDKYPIYRSYINQKLTQDEFQTILQNCVASLKNERVS